MEFDNIDTLDTPFNNNDEVDYTEISKLRHQLLEELNGSGDMMTQNQDQSQDQSQSQSQKQEQGGKDQKKKEEYFDVLNKKELNIKDFRDFDDLDPSDDFFPKKKMIFIKTMNVGTLNVYLK